MNNLISAKNQFIKYRNSDFRNGQASAINFIMESEKKFIFIEAPTGAGKTCIGMIAGVLSGGVNYSCHTKPLQEQIISDHPEAKALKGRSNYICLANKSLNCDSCFHTKSTPCQFKSSCLYEKQKKEVLGSNLRILNFSYLLTEQNYVGKFSGMPFSVIDEADSLEQELVSFTSLGFTAYALRRLNILDMSDDLKKTSKYSEKLLDSWKLFGATAEHQAQAIISNIDKTIESWGNVEYLNESQLSIANEKVKVSRLLAKIKLFNNNVDISWKLDNSQDSKLLFRPLWINEPLAEEFMWRHSSKWVLMSASFLPMPIEAKRLGIPLDEIDYMCLPSSFPIESRKIYIESAANLTAKTMEEEVPKLITRIEEIISIHHNEKGLIHTVSYKLAKQIQDSINSPRFIFHDSTNKQDVLNKFMASSEPLILLSPSSSRGLSLEQDLCRFIIVCKAPFAYLGDPIISARTRSGNGLGQFWYLSIMMADVLQMVGRGMRSKEDYCKSYILDQQFKKVLCEKPSLWPDWIKEAVEFR